MAIANPELIRVLRETARKLENGADYAWGHHVIVRFIKCKWYGFSTATRNLVKVPFVAKHNCFSIGRNGWITHPQWIILCSNLQAQVYDQRNENYFFHNTLF